MLLWYFSQSSNIMIFFYDIILSQCCGMLSVDIYIYSPPPLLTVCVCVCAYPIINTHHRVPVPSLTPVWINVQLNVVSLKLFYT